MNVKFFLLLRRDLLKKVNLIIPFENMKHPSTFLTFYFGFFFLFTFITSEAQDTTTFKPKAEPILKVFANLHSGLSNADNQSAFEVERAYLGFKYQLSREFNIKVNLDIGSPDDISEFSRIRRYAYFKNAALQYSKGFLKIDFGLIDMQHFKLQEEFWGYRYIEKSFSDRFRFGPSADLGMDAIIKLNNFISVDLEMMNGEGYSNLQRDNTFKGGIGTNLKLFDGLLMRFYADFMNKNNTETTLATFVGYKFRDFFKIAGEYNRKFNSDYETGRDRYGYSFYGTFYLPRNLELFARYDYIISNILKDDEAPWSLTDDGSSVIAGIQYSPLKYVRIALNYRDWFPYAKNMTNETYVYLNLEAKL